MRADARLLVVGPAALGAEVKRALPACRVKRAGSLLTALWAAGHEPFDGVLVSYGLGPRVRRFIPSLRQVRPELRVVVSLGAADEPSARALLDAGADEYILEPVTREDLETALLLGRVSVPAPPALQATAPAHADPHDADPAHAPAARAEDVEVPAASRLAPGPAAAPLTPSKLGESVAAALEQLVPLIAQLTQAQSVRIELDDVAVSTGPEQPAVLETPLLRDAVPVGRIELGPRSGGAYSPDEAARLATCAALVVAITDLVRDRQRWQNLALRDDLTGLPNRRFLSGRLEHVLGAARVARGRVTLVLLRVAGLDRVAAPEAGAVDELVLTDLSALLRRCTREYDTVVRYSHDTFALILADGEAPRAPGSQHPQDLASFGERLTRAAAQFELRAIGRPATGEVALYGSLACFPWDASAADDLTRVARQRLAQACAAATPQITLTAGTRPPPDTRAAE